MRDGDSFSLINLLVNSFMHVKMRSNSVTFSYATDSFRGELIIT